ncbi:MAG: hypothetical protein QXV08_08545 [Desulfurococcus sp.]|uniref:hypothetical protein n=1 Tax=Desulfurococcus sp. TaxID=51678 RepID=UPI003181F4B8
MYEYEVTLAPVYIESSSEELGNTRIRRFQKEVADVTEGFVVLSAPTGSGKTVTLLTDREHGVSVGLYPSNELLRSQVAGLHNFIVNHIGMRPEKTMLYDYCRTGVVPEDYIPLNIYVSDRKVDLFGRRVGKIYIVGMSGDVVKAVADRGKLDMLVKVSDMLASIDEDEYAVTLATPDTFFLLTLYAYRNIDLVGRLTHYILLLLRGRLLSGYEEFDKLMRMLGMSRAELEKIARAFLPYRRSSLFIDEYHLYGYYELSSFKALLYTLATVHGWSGRIILSSATPNTTFQEELADEAGMTPLHIDGLSHIKERGDVDELVRGPVRLIFTEVSEDGRSEIARLYGASRRAYELISTPRFREFIEKFREGRGRGAVILEKVSHAEIFAEALYRETGVKPVCMYSMPREDVCEETPAYEVGGSLLVVGTGAKIGQGVEFPRLSFGVVARVTAVDFLQSISRIGRRLEEESIVLVPMAERELKSLAENSVFAKKNVSYYELAEWAEKIGKPLMRKIPSGYETVYRGIISMRESMLKIVGLALHFRLSGAGYGDMASHIERVRISLQNLRIIASPDYMGTLLMFRSSGPSVSYCREIQGVVKCYDEGEDLGTLVRNYEIASCNGYPLIKSVGRGEIKIECKKIADLESFIRRGEERDRSKTLIIIDWHTLRDLFQCRIVVYKNSEEPEELKHLDRELEDQLFLIPNIMNEDLSEYIYRSGKGLRIKLGKGSITLLYL